MKLYDYQPFPNPRRVRMFLAEKQLSIPVEQVDVPAGKHRATAFLKKNPDGAVPLLELDDGTCISETVAISRYFEEQHPQPPLLGTTAVEKATIEMWQRRVEHSLLNSAIAYFHHATDGIGEPERYRNRDWGQHNRSRTTQAMKQLDRALADNSYVAGARFSIADITALCGVDLAIALGIEMPAECGHLKRWHEAVSSRQSAAA